MASAISSYCLVYNLKKLFYNSNLISFPIISNFINVIDDNILFLMFNFKLVFNSSEFIGYFP